MTSTAQPRTPHVENEIRRLWDENAEAWASGVQEELDLFRRAFHDPAFFSLLGDVSGLSIVDLGCGEGTTCRELLARGARTVTGVDISPKMIAAAEASAKVPTSSGEDATQGRISYQVGSFCDALALDPNSIDRVVSVMALMDSPCLERTMENVKRVLKPGGVAVFSVCHPFWDRPGTSWKRTEESHWQLQPGTYFDVPSWLDSWSFLNSDGTSAQLRPFQIRNFPRTISEYVNTAIGAGLEIRAISEPKPGEQKGSQLDAVFERWQQYPFYLMLRVEA